MKLRHLKSSAFVYASAALLSLSASALASDSEYSGSYCSEELVKTEKKYEKFMINFSERVSDGVSGARLARLQAKRANFLHRINNYSFADCTCDDDDDCDISPS